MSSPETSAVKDRTAVQSQTAGQDDVWPKIAQDAYSCSRELKLLGQGLVWGTVKAGYEAFTQRTAETTLNFAATAGLGAAITVASETGPAPVRLAATAAGAYFAVKTAGWLKSDVLDGERWQRIGSAVGDAWLSGANMDRNIAIVQRDAGLLGFDAALVFCGGMAGGKLGRASVRGVSRLDLPGLRSDGRLAAERGALPAVEDANVANSDVKPLDPTNPAHTDKILEMVNKDAAHYLAQATGSRSLAGHKVVIETAYKAVHTAGLKGDSLFPKLVDDFYKATAESQRARNIESASYSGFYSLGA